MKTYILLAVSFIVLISVLYLTVFNDVKSRLSEEEMKNGSRYQSGYKTDFFEIMGPQGWGVTDSNNNIIIPFDYEHVIPCREENVYLCRKGDKYGIVDLHNKVLIPFNHELFEFFDKDKIIRGYLTGLY